jgi:ubiquinone/menaquinone biosynthesis C-methylase UbiE
MLENYEAWDLKDAIKYYETLRNKPEDIYESERVFFFPLVRNSRSILDIGCAAGGIYNIIKTVNPQIAYTGIDVSPGMIEAAKKIFPGVDFRFNRGGTLDFPDNSFDTVMALGVLNHVPDYPQLIMECYRVAKRYCLLDLPRLIDREYIHDIEKSFMILKNRFHSQEAITEGETKVPYILADAGEIFRFLSRDLKPKRIFAKGYYGQCDKSVIIPVDDVCFTVVCLEKGAGDKTNIILDLPRPIRKRIADQGLSFSEPFTWIIETPC